MDLMPIQTEMSETMEIEAQRIPTTITNVQKSIFLKVKGFLKTAIEPAF